MGHDYYVELKNINKTFGDYKASDDVSFGIEKGKLIGLLGPSGSGKTTILRILAGLETPDSGEILIDGKLVNDVPASKRGIGFVFQNYALFRYMTVYDNIAFGLKVQKWSKAEIDARVHEMMELIGLTGLEKRYISQLSGGQRQRVAFARALAPKPNLLLLDEPFAAIDAKVRQELRTWLKEMIATVGVTSIFVTHDQEEAIEVADEIIITNQGRVEQIGSPYAIYQSPYTPFVAQFIGDSAELEDAKNTRGFEYAVDQIDRAVIRPEFLSLYKLDEPVEFPKSVEEGIVLSASFRGSAIEYTVQLNDQTVVTVRRAINEAPIQVGEPVKVFIRRMLAFKGDHAFPLENVCLTDRPAYNL